VTVPDAPSCRLATKLAAVLLAGTHAPADFVVADSAQFPDSDLWAICVSVRRRLPSGHLVARDSYSYSASGGPWRNHEW